MPEVCINITVKWVIAINAVQPGWALAGTFHFLFPPEPAHCALGIKYSLLRHRLLFLFCYFAVETNASSQRRICSAGIELFVHWVDAVPSTAAPNSSENIL